ncbi:hypothetical protein VOLCADRAFT_95486 [Volvox carteri f. nagariensis]|uniref:Uncharacterized protein n=1 Tax=Volvox carteri f. nagariensis TaxID=3068 RepID=D8U7L2_VOLCA|nr:uncharacterized protein VOLCADRAFT_95486 [Volvox carteri f. nagariensis]EFJ44320.1 hypothetical protein VOLCADRAFT_95486 [Volvox carteri f. nagariensis]|eukprot:XP_002954679.1 hypothetical protein VOLCADRAFT_95486 [Volvox carteri f. nagariensis]
MKNIPRSPGQSYIDWNEHREASFHTVKSLYEAQACKRRLPFFHEFQIDRVILATRVFYKVLFGHFGDDVVSGYKEIRYICGVSFASQHCPEQFYAFLSFARQTCLNTKVLLLTRKLHSADANPEMFESLTGGQKVRAIRDLERTHELYNEYAQNYPEHAYRICMEDMFNQKTNTTLARNLLTFLREDPSRPIRFTRMPPR